MTEATSPEARSLELVRWHAGQTNQVQDHVAAEEPLEIRIRGRSIVVTMRTPGHDTELAAGFLLTEGILNQREDVLEIAHCQQAAPESRENIVNVFLAPGVEVDLERLTRHVFASSSCGVCGKASIEAVEQCFLPVSNGLQLGGELIISLPGKLRAAQAAFESTGGLHAAGIFDRAGKLVTLREDVGRHNAVDKVIGAEFLARRWPCENRILLVSGRTSFEILQKALAARIPVVAAISAPSSLAVDFARRSGQTLIGFLRDGGFNIYSHPERITSPHPDHHPGT